MSSVSGSILGAYLSMVPATYIFSAIPLNCINALILANVLNPVEVTKEEDVVYKPSKVKKDFFSTISNSMLVGMNMVIVILAMVIGYVALTACLNGILGFL